MTSPEKEWEALVRIRVLGLLMVVALLGLVTALWRMQVRHATRYVNREERQSVRRVRLPAPRGRMFDRNGVCLADNRPSYCVAFYVEEMRRPGRWDRTVDEVERVADQLARVLELPRTLTRPDIESHIRRRLPLALIAWRDVPARALARLAESQVPFPGVDIEVEAVRYYPEGDLAGHVLGYVGRADPELDPDEPFHFYLPEMEGKNGMEQVLDRDLAGAAGGRLLRVDASGFRNEELADREPLPGRDVTLALDARIQRLAERVMSGVRSAVVVLDPRNGDVLALASSPSYDPNQFTPRIPAALFRAMLADEGKPFFNRAIAGTYAPGSIFKPVVAVTALESRRATGDTEFDCPGYFALGPTRIHCWNRQGHGVIAMRKAIEQSCNTYFCHLGMECGHERIYHMAAALGLGRPTGIELAGEAAGLLPNNEWKIERVHDAWRPGDTGNLSIGQGYLAVTPLQMAMVCATLGNGGRVFRPRLVLERGAVGGRTGRKAAHGDRSWTEPRLPGELLNSMGWSRTTLDVVRGGMLDVVQQEVGTGKRARIEAAQMGGKTGTAEFGPRGRRTKFGWMIVFAPFDQPRYAVAMVTEEAISGGITTAPRIHDLMQGIFALEESS